jgi:hypothetical protein
MYRKLFFGIQDKPGFMQEGIDDPEFVDNLAIAQVLGQQIPAACTLSSKGTKAQSPGLHACGLSSLTPNRSTMR